MGPSNCYTKSFGVWEALSAAGIISGKTGCGGGCIETDTGITGANVIGTLDIMDPGICGMNCFVTPGCKSYTFDTANQRCFLWDSDGETGETRI